MEQAKQLNDAVEALGNLQNLLGELNLSELKVAMRIKNQIAKMEDELLETVSEHEIFSDYDLEQTPEEIVQTSLKEYFDDELVFKQALKTVAEYNSVDELEMVEVESIIDKVGDLARTIGTYKRQIKNLEELLN
jgi:hypothetical protein